VAWTDEKATELKDNAVNGENAAAKEIAEDKAAGKEEAQIDENNAEKIENTAEADTTGTPNKQSGSSWFSWLWPFSSSSSATKEDKKSDEVKKEAGENEVAEAAPVQEVAAPAAEAPAEPKVAATDKSAKKSSVGRKILLYFPNLFLNLSDIFSMGIGLGAEAGVEVRLTRYCQFGGKYGDVYFVEKGFDRRFGGGYDDGYNFQLAALAGEKRYVDKTFGGVKGYICKQAKARINSPSEPLYKDHNRDFWAVGAEAGWLINVRFDIHPVQIADFFASLIALDMTGDSLK